MIGILEVGSGEDKVSFTLPIRKNVLLNDLWGSKRPAIEPKIVMVKDIDGKEVIISRPMTISEIISFPVVSYSGGFMHKEYPIVSTKIR